MKKIMGLLLVTLLASASTQVSAANAAEVSRLKGNTWKFINSDLSGANFVDQHIEGAYIKNGNFDGLKGRNLRILYSSLLECKFTNADLREAQFIGINGYEEGGPGFLSSAEGGEGFLSFEGANLTDASFSRSYLAFANFRSVTFVNTKFYEVDLDRADFTNTHLIKVSFQVQYGKPLPSGGFLAGAKVKGALFTNVKGLSNKEIRSLERRGAVFETSPTGLIFAKKNQLNKRRS